ncbi:hypothetical protein [Fructobacillus pseudoficulneus]|nr:hypothetical protein [Fructobacillus pseudoficulneus]SEH38233.1 hypothetical protein SAMN05660469_0500 [Fructobacillus pseudoficulneus]
MAIISDKDFIRYLSQQRKLSKINDLAQQFLLHPIHIYRLLQMVNQDLKRAGLPPLLVQRSISSNQAHFLAVASQNWSLGFSWSAQERRQMLDLLMTLPLQRWTSQLLQEFFTVSKNTITRDLAELKKQNHFPLRFSQQWGYFFAASHYHQLIHGFNLIYRLQEQQLAILLELTGYSLRRLHHDQNHLTNLYQEQLGKNICFQHSQALLLFTSLMTKSQEWLQKNPTYKTSPFFSTTDQQLLRDRREYHILASFLQNKFPKLTGQQKENIHLILTLQLLSFAKELDQKARAATFKDLLQISQSISTGIIPKIGLSKMEQNRVNTNKLVQAIQTQLKPFWFVNHFAADNHYLYLLPQPKIENILQQLLQQEPLKTKVDQHFPLGLTNDQVRILAIIISHHQNMAKIKPTLKILFETNLPIYSRQLIIDFINGLPITCQITVRVISPQNQLTDITEGFDLLITEKTKSTAAIPPLSPTRTTIKTKFNRP